MLKEKKKLSIGELIKLFDEMNKEEKENKEPPKTKEGFRIKNKNLKISRNQKNAKKRNLLEKKFNKLNTFVLKNHFSRNEQKKRRFLAKPIEEQDRKYKEEGKYLDWALREDQPYVKVGKNKRRKTVSFLLPKNAEGILYEKKDILDK